jgi:hypothetical protein
MGDKQHAARVAWATIKRTQAGQRPVSLDQLATHVPQGRLIPVRSFTPKPAASSTAGRPRRRRPQ